MGRLKDIRRRIDGVCLHAWSSAKTCLVRHARKRAGSTTEANAGQGTTEYAILVGVLVVIAILAIMIFRPRLQELWNAIAEGINGL